MLIDRQLLMSNAQAITATAVSTDIYDTGTAVANWGAGTPIQARAHVIQAFNNLTSLTVELQTSAAEAFGTSKVLASRVIALADLTANRVIDLGVVPESAQRYLRFRYVVTGTAPTQGTVTAYFAPEGTVQSYGAPVAA